MINIKIKTTEEFEKEFKKLTKKNKALAEQIAKAIMKLKDKSKSWQTLILRPKRIQISACREMENNIRHRRRQKTDNSKINRTQRKDLYRFQLKNLQNLF